MRQPISTIWRLYLRPRLLAYIAVNIWPLSLQHYGAAASFSCSLASGHIHIKHCQQFLALPTLRCLMMPLHDLLPLRFQEAARKDSFCAARSFTSLIISVYAAAATRIIYRFAYALFYDGDRLIIALPPAFYISFIDI